MQRPSDIGRVADARMRVASATEEAVAGTELSRLIDERLPLELRADYLKMLAGASVPIDRRRKVQDAVRDVLDDLGLDFPQEDDDASEHKAGPSHA